MHDSSCVFCKIIAGTIPSTIIARTEHSIAIKDIHPKAPIHYLVMPKKHIISMSHLTVLDNDIVVDMADLVKSLGSTLNPVNTYNLISNNGAAAGQSVFHLHWHLLAGRNIYEGSLQL